MATSTKSNVRDYHRRHKTINIGIIAFGIMFIYIAIMVYIYMTKDNISIYQITTEGSLASNNEYFGLILRDEHIVTTDKSGYIKYYLPTGEKAGKNDLIYSLDESGEVTKALAEEISYTETIKEMDLSGLKTQITSFAYNFSADDFDMVYDFKTMLSYSLLDLVNYNNPDYLTKLLANVEINDSMFNLYYSDCSANVAYYFDGYEQLVPAGVKPENFNTNSYVRTTLNSTDFVEAGTNIYKYVDDNNWNLVFQLSEEDVIRYNGLSALTVSFPDYDLVLTVPFEILKNETGSYGVLRFNSYMAQFINSRYIEFEIIYSDISGLKIPISSVVSKDFYIIPLNYQFTSQGSKGFYLETTDPTTGNTTLDFVEPTIYNSTETHYYVDTSAFTEGSYLVDIDTKEHYRIGPRASLSGVYNVNKGYTIFRKVEILDKNDEYYIVSNSTKYGIALYDHIILNGKIVTEGQVIYQ